MSCNKPSTTTTTPTSSSAAAASSARDATPLLYSSEDRSDEQLFDDINHAASSKPKQRRLRLPFPRPSSTSMLRTPPRKFDTRSLLPVEKKKKNNNNKTDKGNNKGVKKATTTSRPEQSAPIHQRHQRQQQQKPAAAATAATAASVLKENPKDTSKRYDGTNVLPLRQRRQAASKQASALDPPSSSSQGGGGGGEDEKKTDDDFTALLDNDNNNNNEPSLQQQDDKQQQSETNNHKQSHIATTTTTTTTTTTATMTPPSLRVKSVLSRPFGRSFATSSSSSTSSSSKRYWVPHVSAPEWDADAQCWKYRVLVQRRNILEEKQHVQSTSTSTSLTSSSNNNQQQQQQQQHSSFCTALLWRSMADFVWLERALRQEFAGGYLLPSLRLAILDNNDNDDNNENDVAAAADGSDNNILNSNLPVKAEALRDWLFDVLNGMRGQGECWLVLSSSPPSSNSEQQQQQQQTLQVRSASSSPRRSSPDSFQGDEIVKAECMEAFLYKNSIIQQQKQQHNHASTKRQHKNKQHKQHRSSKSNSTGDNSLLHTLWSRPLSLVPLEMFCVGPEPRDTATNNNNNKFAVLDGGILASCSSRALSTTPSLDVNDSIVQRQQQVDHYTEASFSSSSSSCSVEKSPRRQQQQSSSLPCSNNRLVAIHSELIQAETSLLLNYLSSALAAMQALLALKRQEVEIGQNWKRFATALLNLFAYEKDVEHARLGSSGSGESNKTAATTTTTTMKVKKENMPYRKIEKSQTEDSLRELARHKQDRAVPALDALQVMLRAFVVDLRSVQPSVDAYCEATLQLTTLIKQEQERQEADWQRSSSWEERIKAVAASTMDDVKRHAMLRKLQEAAHSASPHRKKQKDNDGDDDDDDDDDEERVSVDVFQERLQSNERLLQRSLTSLCRATPLRAARMAWRYWYTEANQCALVNTAATTLRNCVDNVASREAVSKMHKRHSAAEKDDAVAELNLVQRIVDIQKHAISKFSTSPPRNNDDGDKNNNNDNRDEIEVDSDACKRREKALEIARERVGRWDPKVSLAIMEAVGVDDPNVRMEETTKDLRLIRKYAIGLREHLNRCVEAIQLLRSSYSKGKDQDKSISDKRSEFLVRIAELFSAKFIAEKGAPKRSSPSFAVLSKAGVDTTDPMGWSSAFGDKRYQASRNAPSQGSVGDLAVAYLAARDSQTEWLLDSINDLLLDYSERVEIIEGFVYMECVGIQLEKHFSQKRATALSAFEKKTDITTAINVANRKRLTQLVNELKAKLDDLGPDVTHTQVKETKEVHLESKSLKAELHELAIRRLTRARETSTERVVNLISLWAKEEEAASTSELKALGEAMVALERAVENHSAEFLINTPA